MQNEEKLWTFENWEQLKRTIKQNGKREKDVKY